MVESSFTLREAFCKTHRGLHSRRIQRPPMLLSFKPYVRVGLHIAINYIKKANMCFRLDKEWKRLGFLIGGHKPNNNIVVAGVTVHTGSRFELSDMVCSLTHYIQRDVP